MTDDQLGPPPVEPLSDLAWARVERGLWARMDTAAPGEHRTPSRRWWWLGAPALAIAATAAIVIVARGGDPGVAIESEPVRLVSGAAPSSVTIGDAHVTLEAEAAVVMSPEASGPNALVERGAAWFAIAPRTGRPFVVAAGDLRVRVIGTRFRVARYEELATVEVEHGLVEVTYRGTTVSLSAGQTWSSMHPSEITAMHAPPADPAEPIAVEPVPAPVAEPAPAETIVPPPRRTPRKPPAERTREPTTTTSTVAPADRAQADPAATKYHRLQALERRRPKTAMKGYLEISRGTGPWAEVALFAAGRLATDRREPRAATLLHIYLRRFPDGANAVDARHLLQRLEGDQ